MKRLAILCVAFLATTCGGREPSSSSSTAPSPIALTASTVSSISGFVEDTGFRPLAGARVVVVGGPQAGAAAIADASGQFSLAGTFDGTTRFRATKDGYLAAEQTWNCSVGPGSCSDTGARPWLGFYLAAPTPPVSLAGEYTVTFVADNACVDLPAEARTRTYTLSVTPASAPNVPAGTSYTATAGGATFLGSLNNFPIGVSGDYADLWLHGGHDPALVEQIRPGTYLAISGNAATALATSPVNVSTAFDGWIEYCAMPGPMGANYSCRTSPTHCESAGHRVTLTRR